MLAREEQHQYLLHMLHSKISHFQTTEDAAGISTIQRSTLTE